MNATQKRPVGRPPIERPKTHALQIRVEEDMWDDMNTYLDRRGDPRPQIAELVRAAIRRFLADELKKD